MIKKNQHIALILAVALATSTCINSMEHQESTSFWKTIKTCFISLLLITGGALAQQENSDTQLPECMLNKTRIALAAEQAHQTGQCVNFCSFPYVDAYFNCEENEFHMSACANTDLAETLPPDLIKKAADERTSSLDFLVYNAAHEDEQDIKYLQYPYSTLTPPPPSCTPFNKSHYDETVALARKTGICEHLCADPSQNCNRDGGGELFAKRVYAYALCPEKAFAHFPDDCKQVVQNLQADKTMAMGFLWNDHEYKYSNKKYNRSNTQLLECPMMKKVEQKKRVQKRKQ